MKSDWAYEPLNPALLLNGTSVYIICDVVLQYCGGPVGSGSTCFCVLRVADWQFC